MERYVGRADYFQVKLLIKVDKMPPVYSIAMGSLGFLTPFDIIGDDVDWTACLNKVSIL